MELRKFRNQYDLELISAPYADMICGMQVWDPLMGKPKLDPLPGASPKFGQISSSIAVESIKKFSFGALQVRSLPQILRIRIDDFIEQLRVAIGKSMTVRFVGFTSSPSCGTTVCRYQLRSR